MDAERISPHSAGNAAEAKKNIHGIQNARHDSKRLPPFAKRLKPSRSRTLWVCIGSDCWERTNSPTWFPGYKVLIPPGEEPSAFKWSFVTDFADTAIIVDGEQPETETITTLVRELLIHVDSVLFLPSDRHPVRFSLPQARRAA